MTAPYYQGMYHPHITQQPGAGEALAGGLQNVLAALLQRHALEQNALMQQADLAQKHALTGEATQRGDYYSAEAAKARQSATPAPRAGHVQVQPDGSVVLIDPVTGKVTPVQGARGIPTVHNIDPNSPAGVASRINGPSRPSDSGHVYPIWGDGGGRST
jgi:hypothetical protein